MDKFIDPKAAVTPFFAGVAVMIITATCWSAFGLPPTATALVLSAGFGFLSVSEFITPFFNKSIYMIINTLIVFSSAYGDTLMVKNLNSNLEMMDYHNPSVSVVPAQQRGYFVDWFKI